MNFGDLIPALSSIVPSVITLFTLCVSLYSIRFVRGQLDLSRSQLQLDFALRLSSANREILTLAFNDNDLFLLLENKPMSDSRKQRHYIQVWLNHVNTIWTAKEHGLLSPADWYSLEKDMIDFFEITLIRKRWEEVKQFYPPGFVQFVAKALTQTVTRVIPPLEEYASQDQSNLLP